MSTLVWSNAESITDQFNDALRALINEHAPEKTRSVRLRPNAPLYTDNLREMKREKRQHERKYISTRLEVHRLLYRDNCDEYTATLNFAKSQYYKAKISEYNNQQLFQMIDGLFQVENTTPLPTRTSLPHLAE